MAAIDEKGIYSILRLEGSEAAGAFLRPYRGAPSSPCWCSTASALVDVVLPLFQKYAIQNFIEKNTLTGLLPHALAYLAVVVQALSVWPLPENPCTSR